jgi:hypothetical protein
MKASNLVLFLVFNILSFHTQGMSQTLTATAVKPKITSKSVSVSPKKVVSVSPKRTVPVSPKRTVPASPRKAVPASPKRAVSSNSSQIKFDNISFDLGTIKEDAVIEKAFEFVNTGTQDLVIIEAKGSCGCTIPTAPTMPIAPGSRGKILVKYTAKNKVGPQKPTITVTTNGIPSIVKLNMDVWVDQIPGGVN